MSGVCLVSRGIYFAIVTASALIVSGQKGLLPTLNFQEVNPDFYGPTIFYQYRQYVGGFLASGMLMGLFLINKKNRINYLLIFPTILIAAAIFGIGSTAGVTLAAISIIVILFLIFSVKIYLPSVILILLWFGIFFSDSYWISFYAADFSRMGERFDVWEGWVTLMKNAGILGEGFVFNDRESRLYGSHSQMLDIILRGGVPFLALWLLIVFYTFYRSYVLIFNTSKFMPASFKLAIPMALFGQIILFGVVVVPFQQPLTGVLIWALIALQELLITAGKNRDENE